MVIATGANEQNLPHIRRGTSKSKALVDPPQSMEDIAKGARKVLNYIENNDTTTDMSLDIFKLFASTHLTPKEAMARVGQGARGAD